MNREIIFRGKRVDNGEWVEGFYCGKVNKTFFSLAEDSAQIIDKDLWWHEVTSETVGQYTGLTDENGKKIFEGDFVKHFNHFDKPDEYAIYKVEFDERTCRFSGRLHKQWSAQLSKDLEKRYEVIGNIHDNPELLEVHNG